MKLKPSILIPALLLLVGGSIAFWWAVDAPRAALPPIESDTSTGDDARTGSKPDATLHEDTAALRAAPQSEPAARAAIQKMMERLWNVPPAQLGKLVRDYLDSGEDAPTGLRFDIGMDGCITDPPTMRVALLDLLARLAPDEAIALGKEWLQKTDNQDEWAAALRCAALAHEAGEATGAEHAFLREQVSRRLHQKEWLADPSAGFLCAFDAASLLASPSIYEDLAAIHADAALPPHTRDAASLALRDAAQNYPQAFTTFLLENPTLLRTEPALRGALLSSTDVRQPAAQAALLAHLQRPTTPEPEVRAFIAQFPQSNWVAGVRLFTSDLPPAIPAEGKGEQYTAALALLTALQTQRPDLAPDTRTLLEKKTTLTKIRLEELNTAQR